MPRFKPEAPSKRLKGKKRLCIPPKLKKMLRKPNNLIVIILLLILGTQLITILKPIKIKFKTTVIDQAKTISTSTPVYKTQKHKVNLSEALISIIQNQEKIINGQLILSQGQKQIYNKK